jgi:RNA polymerase sigma-70 factor (ECF subfamily)
MDGITRDAMSATSIVERAAGGDTVAFARLVATYHADMIRVAYVVGGGAQDVADDAVQAAWAVAWTKLGSVREPSRVKSWLVAVAANEARQLARHEHRRTIRQIELDSAPPDIADPTAPDPATHADVLDLEDALHHLSPDERVLLALRYEAGLDSTEIGHLLGDPAATVRWRLSRLVARLRKELLDA